MKRLHARLWAGLVLALMLTLGMAQTAPALDLGGVTGGLGQNVGPQLAQVLADKLGLNVPVGQVMGLLDKGKAVNGTVEEPSKLSNLGLSNVSKGDVMSLLNQGNDKLSITPQSGGDGITQNIGQLFGPMSKMFK